MWDLTAHFKRKYSENLRPGRLIFLFASSIGCSVILFICNWAFLLIEKCQNCHLVLDLLWHDNVQRTKMTTVSRFSCQKDADLRALNIVLWENLVLVVVMVLESKGPYWSWARVRWDTSLLLFRLASYLQPGSFWLLKQCYSFFSLAFVLNFTKDELDPFPAPFPAWTRTWYIVSGWRW